MQSILRPFLAVLVLLSSAAWAQQASLKETGDIGRVMDVQGVASVRAKGGNRWSLATVGFPLKPGDWVRTDVRGANALRLRLSGGGEVVLGPGTLVEVRDGSSVGFTSGELEATAGKTGDLVIMPSEGKSYALRDGDRKVFRRPDGRGVQVLEKDPNWLLGFKGAVTTESMGSLLATVDGRNTPLTLGYHKVTVDIRDQIARTVIEESFVNHTDGRLEGVFYFPLPQDASISGFGMWINGELVEADVVEKQRAREIYETILRERRDPGLLEWTGGNIFKARVFPILPHSEKRIKITYTQVLPLRKGAYRYRYALQSEMLRENPLRELSINVRVSSALPITGFSCGTHPARVEHTAHAAQAEFTAQEYTPDQDFELDIAVDASASPVVVIPHRRGEDGYFLALVTPPGGEGGWESERGLIPDGDPIEFVIVADTSGSMDATARANQDALIGALLSSLGPNDRYELATCDNELRWFKPGDGVGGDAVLEARDWVAARTSLGWTDLDKAFTAVCARVKGKTNAQVIYIGDGVLSTGDADPVAFANRLQRLCGDCGATFHAVAPSSRYEPGVLKAIAAIGGGSRRRIEGSDTAVTVAGALLSEIARPGLRDLKVEFTGVRVARVYPEALPNLPAGEQQIVLGRYLPEGKEQRGEIVVTGRRNGREERFTAPLTVADAEAGNSFIPRLWARMYLDVLLEQGTSQTIQNEIVALSEEYKIMTPYTSFLVLESDEDRERFKVKRRFEMRDGERFFAEGRDAAQEELLAKQMRLAGTWRMNLRRGFLGEISMMGREDYTGFLQERMMAQNYPTSVSGPWGGGRGGFGGGGFANEFGRPISTTASISGFKGNDRYDANGLDSASEGWEASERDFVSDVPWGDAEMKEEEFLGERMEKISDESSDLDGISLYAEQQPALRGRQQAMASADYRSNRGLAAKPQGRARQAMLGEKLKSLGTGREYAGYGHFNGDHWRDRVQDLLSLFPPLIESAGKPEEEAAEHPWPQSARELADSLLRGAKLAERKDGVRVLVKQTGFDTRRDVANSRAETLALVSGERWLVRTSADRVDTQVDWWREGGERGRLHVAVGLGRTRTGEKADSLGYPGFLADSSLVSLATSARHLTATVKPLADGRSELVLEDAGKRYRGVYVIDTKRKVLVSMTSFYDGKKSGSTEFLDFVEVAGCWWAKRSEMRDADGKVTATTDVEVEALAEDTFTAVLKEQLLSRQKAVEIANVLPSVAAAKNAPSDGKPGFDFSFALFNHFVETQQWERADTHFEEMRAFADGKPGFGILETRYLIMKRRNEEARARIFVAAKALAESRDNHELFLANQLRAEANTVASAAENHDLLELLKPVYERAAERLVAMRDWKQAMVSALQNINRSPEAVALQRQIAEEFPWDANAQTQYANLLSNTGDYHAALDWLDKVMGEDERAWTPGEISGFRMACLNFLENQSWIEEVARRTEEWLKAPDVDEAGSFYYLRSLSALIRLDKVDEAHALIDTWLKDGVAAKGDALDARSRNRLSAAIEIHLGRGYGVNPNEIPERFHAGLSRVVRAFALDPKDASLAEMLMNDYRFSGTEAARALRKHFTTVLEKRAARMPLGNVNRLIGWISVNVPAIDKVVWESIVADLLKRWEAAKKTADRDAFASTVEGILSRSLGRDRYLDFLRLKMRESEEARRGEFANQLLEALINGLWTPEIEAEAFDLLYSIDFPGEAEVDLRAQRRVSALVRLDDWALRTRVAAAWEKVEQPEYLSRTARAEKEAEILREAREALEARLGEEMEMREGGTAEAMMEWLNAERLYLGVLLKDDLKEIAAECWEYLGKHDLFDRQTLEGLSWSESALVDRHLAILENLATRSKADKALVARLLQWLERGIAAYPDDAVWKGHLQRMLVVLDRPDVLKSALAEWTAEASPERNTWRIALGYLHAELNEIAEAARGFEAVEQDDELGPDDYRVLADWYLLLKREDDRARAILARYQAMEEWSLSNLIQQHSSRIENGFNNGVPEDFDPEVVPMFKAIFRKSPNPGNHLYLLGSLYRYTKDFRLLQCVPEGVIGNSAGQIYPFLQNMNQVLQYVNDEAVCDEILAHLEIVRKRAKTRVDARGLDLLEMLVRRKAAEVINQPGQQLPRALEAMRRAFKGDEWGTGERRLMAAFLASLGSIALEPLAAEQRAELEALYRESEVGTPDRLHIGASFAGCLHGYGLREKAVDILGGAITEYRAAAGGIFTQEEQSPFDQWIGYHESDRHFAEGEKQLAEAMDARLPEVLRQWLVERKYRLYSNALSNGGRVSLGEGRALFDNVRKALAGELVTPHHNHRYQLCSLLIGVYRAAHSTAKIAGVPEALAQFAGDPFDELVSVRTGNYQNLVQQLGGALQEIAGDRAALAFLIARYEAEPEFFRATGQGGWSRYGYQMAEYRSRVAALGGLEARLLKIARAELRRDLETGSFQNRFLYHDDYNYFWAEKRADFLSVAESVLTDRAKLLSTVRSVSDYLFNGIEARERAVEVLVTAHQETLLDEGGVSQLADFLERMQRDKEAVAYLVELVGMTPGNMDYRRRLIGSLGRSGQRDQAVAAVDAAMAWAKENRVWNEASLAPIAQGCHEGQYWDRGVVLYDELISLHQQTQPNRGIGNGTLSDYYTRLADCHVGLGQTVEAVEAAAGAIVSWGPRDDQRASALAMLRKVLSLSKDLDAYVAHLDGVVDESGLENPTVRKALGGVYSDRKEFDKAVAQLQLAAETQPEDTETQQLLVAAYDALGNGEAAVAQLVEAIHRSPRSIALLKDLGDRFENLQQALEAERARTGIVEALPNESEGHAMLAEIRQTQDRWPEAAAHWEQVAVLRKLEPTGLLNLARAEAKANASDKAKASAEKVLAREWPSRFGDVHTEARRILAELEKG